MKIGITGGIGSGKSFFARRLQAEGYHVYNCDDEAKRLMQHDADIRRRLTDLIGPETYLADGRLNKAAVAEYLFANPQNAANVNAIVHPAVKADFLRWADRQQGKPCFMESAILYEANFQTTVDKIILVWADEPTRLRRATERDQTTAESVRERMAQQLPAEQLQACADYVVDNSATADTQAETARLLRWIATLQ